ncbi:DivIVA domain-containing protein, partial [Intrasporangium sp.]|uniref:DivIVA domain-containing protein n=1 Tax=Intrasporangium sp. TaxID=1925024 RepID=UPI00293B0E8E
MALTPEQVLNKHFQTTQFRRGYEERDVDDFLDEIVAEMRSLIEQRDDYLKQLNDCRASKNQPAVRGGDGPTQAMPPVGRPGDDAKLGALTAKIQDAERAFKAASDRAAKAKAEADAAERAARERIERAKADAERAEAAARSAVDEKALNEAQAKLNALHSQVADAEAKLAKTREEAKAAEEAARAAELAARQRSQAAMEAASAAASAPAATAANTSGADAAGVIALAQRLHDEHVAAGEARRH